MISAFKLNGVDANTVHFYDKKLHITSTEIVRRRSFGDSDSWEGSDLFQLCDGATGIAAPTNSQGSSEPVYLSGLRQVRTTEEYALDLSEFSFSAPGSPGFTAETQFFNNVLTVLNGSVAEDVDYSTASLSGYNLTGFMQLVNGKPTLVLMSIETAE